MSTSRLRLYERSPAHQHLSESDRYLLKGPVASKRVVIIGTGTVGQEHMYVAFLLGRMRVHGIYDTEPDSMDAAESYFQSYSEQSLVRYSGLKEACNDPEADALIILTDVAGLLDGDPRVNPAANVISSAGAMDATLDQMAGGSTGGLGRGGMVTKVRAARLAARSGAHTVIASGHEPRILERLIEGEVIDRSIDKIVELIPSNRETDRSTD